MKQLTTSLTRSNKSQGRVLGPALNEEQQCTCVYACVHAQQTGSKEINQTITFWPRFAYKPFYATPVV